MNTQKFKILILGGGTGGISVAARLAKSGYAHQIAILEPSAQHHYQPYWTLISSGQIEKSAALREQSSVIPSGVQWIQDSVKEFIPIENAIITIAGRRIDYEILVVALGLELNYEKIKGAPEALGKNGVISAYRHDLLDATKEGIVNFKGGTAIFTMPPVPIKCAGAPQKIMYLADAVWRNSGVRNASRIIFASAGAAIFGVKEFAEPLNQVMIRKGIETKFQSKLVEVKAEQKIAVFEQPPATQGQDPTTSELSYDLLHIVPPMSAPTVIKVSQLASTEATQKGWLAVDKYTLQHLTYPNVFGVGDVTGIPNSKTGAAIRKQAPIVAENIRRYQSQNTDLLKYDGYSSCPLITDIGKVILAEFGYDGKLMPSFPLDPTKERRIYWHLKKDLLPYMYWYGMLKGRM